MTRFSARLLAAGILALTALPASAQTDKRHLMHYLTCDRSPWSAYMTGYQFHHAPERGPGHMDSVIHYLTWDGSCWEARWNTGLRQWEHTPLTRPGPMHRDVILNYLGWRNEKLTAKKTFDDYFIVTRSY